nr:ribonuclease H-like domain-containing protein [Tanacetum cinerariifolium]
MEGVDVDETFSLVVKLGTIRTVMSLATSQHWPIHQLDVKNAFLHRDLSETVYMHQPSGFQGYAHLDYVCYSGLFMGSSKPFGLGFNTLHLTLLGLKKYAIEILEKAHIVSCNPSQTSVDTESKLGVDGDPKSDLTLYRSLADLVTYSDADLAGYATTRRSTSGYCVFLGNNLLSWSTKGQSMLSRSSAEAEYRGVANAVGETCWLRNLLRELHTPLSSATL